MKHSVRFCAVFVFLLFALTALAQQPAVPKPTEGEFTLHNFHFQSGETLPNLRIHYYALGKPVKDSEGKTKNAVLILHGTTGSGRQFLNTIFAGVLFGPGQLLDVSRYYVILVDNIGHGKSSKPSDGMHAHFPRYDYDDMVKAQHDLLVDGLGVNHLRLVMGTSMGCMHSFVWGETYPEFMDALMPLACLPVQIAGRNRIWRQMTIDGIRSDPEWKDGDYTTEPRAGLQLAADFLLIAGSAPRVMQKNLPTRDQADQYLEKFYQRVIPTLDANDFLYAVDSSRNYDPSPDLDKIVAPLMWINSADDFINPPELGIAEQEVKKIKKGKFVLLPISDKTHGHGTHTDAAVWQEYLKELLAETER
ncbi:MAG: alpha/beta fold hydrolase [Terriglobia bacterium]|nr:alpha/beta fold hydrolase [Terriglobia bacterium]